MNGLKTLLDVAKNLLAGVEFDDTKFRDQLPNIFYEFHQIANISCIKMETNLK
jgi:hypothetical protein